MPNLNRFVKIYTDGACRPNPGHGAIGILILNEKDQELATCKKCIGETTNNGAEYHALIQGLNSATDYCTWKAVCFSDSLVVINQLNRKWRIHNRELRELHKEVRVTAGIFKEVEYRHISSNSPYIKRADKLAKEALKEG
jgi:ribonuclease HI